MMDINQEKDNEFDKALRPLDFTDFIGQLSIINNLKIFVEASNQRNDALDHTLFHGPPGLGKTTLAHILANELKVGLKVTSGPVIDKPGDLAGLLTSLEERDILFIDEIHRLSPVIEEYLYSAMEDFSLDLTMGASRGTRCRVINLPRFTLIGATTKLLFMEMNRQKKLRKLRKYLKARRRLMTFFLCQIGRIHPTRTESCQY